MPEKKSKGKTLLEIRKTVTTSLFIRLVIWSTEGGKDAAKNKNNKLWKKTRMTPEGGEWMEARE